MRATLISIAVMVGVAYGLHHFHIWDDGWIFLKVIFYDNLARLSPIAARLENGG